MHHLIHHPLDKRKAKDFWTKLLYRITIIAGVISPLMVWPQIFKIYSTQDAAGVSALSWFAFAVLDIPFIIYGVIHKEKPIVITYTMFLIGNAIVAVGAVIYG